MLICVGTFSDGFDGFNDSSPVRARDPSGCSSSGSASSVESMEQDVTGIGGSPGSPCWTPPACSSEAGDSSSDVAPSSSDDSTPAVGRGRGRGRARGGTVGRGRGRGGTVGRGRARGGTGGRGRGWGTTGGRGRALGATGGRGRGQGATGRRGRGQRGGAVVGLASGLSCCTPPDSSDDTPTPSPPPISALHGTHPSRGVVCPTTGSLEEVGGKWKKVVGPTSVSHIYQQTPGVTCSSLTSTSTPLELFNQFFTPEVWDLMVQETNRYAASTIAASTARSTRPWTDTTVQELQAFIGIIILMGIVRLPRLELYWSQKYPEVRISSIADVMSQTRFEQLFRFLHLNDNANQIPFGQPGHD